MNTYQIIESEMDAEIKRIFAPKPDVMRFILNHPRKKICIENLTGQINKEEIKGVKFSKDHLKAWGASFARNFSELAIKQKEEELLTENKRQQLYHEAELTKEAQKVIDEGINGVDEQDSSKEL